MGNPRTITDLDQPVRDIMATVSIEMGPVATLREVADLLSENDIGSVPVIHREDRSLIGIVGERDLVRALADNVDLEDARVGDVMTFSAVTVTPDTTVRQATERMTDGGIRHLPVVGDDGKLIGVLSMRDLLTAHATVSG